MYVDVLRLVIVNVTKYRAAQKAVPLFYFCDNVRKGTLILTLFSLLEQEIYGA